MKTYQDVLNETDFSKFDSDELEEIARALACEIFQSMSMIHYHKRGLVVFDYRVAEQHNIARFGRILVEGINDKSSIEDRIYFIDNLKDFIIYIGTLNYKSPNSVKKKLVESVKRVLHKNNLKKRY